MDLDTLGWDEDVLDIQMALEQRRREHDMSLNEVARRADMSMHTVNSICGGEARTPRIDKVAKVARALGYKLVLVEQ